MTQEKRSLHIHIQARRDAPDVFMMTKERWQQAILRHPDLAEQVRCTVASARTSSMADWTPEDRIEFRQAMATANVLVGYRFPTEDLGVIAPNLLWIHIIGAGVEHLLPLEWLPPSVKLVNNRGAHAPKTTEYAMLAILMLGNVIPRLVTAQRKMQWDQCFSSIVEGKTLVILGMGEQGKSVARGAKKLGLHVIGVDIQPHPLENCDEVVPTTELHRVLPFADFIGVAVPLTPQTRHIIGREELDLMKKTAGLFNIARAPVIDYEVLAEKLKAQELGGALLDVFDQEPLPPESPLWLVPNLMITPHVGCDDATNYIARTFDIVLQNVRRYLKGEPLVNEVDRSRGF